jgi:hypothetical protein
MKTFKSFILENQLITEKIISIGLHPSQESQREKHRQEIHDILHRSYAHPSIGGYSGHSSGSKEESDAIHKDISNSVIKATKRNGKITSVNLYKKQYGRKSIASGTDGSPQGKKDWSKTKIEDHEQKRAWSEVSGAAEHYQRKIGVPVIPSNKAGKLLNKEIHPHEDGEHYGREIGGSMHTKVMMGYTKENA